MNKLRLLTPLLFVPTILLPVSLTSCQANSVTTIKVDKIYVDVYDPYDYCYIQTQGTITLSPGRYKFVSDFSKAHTKIRAGNAAFWFANENDTSYVDFEPKNLKVMQNDKEIPLWTGDPQQIEINHYMIIHSQDPSHLACEIYCYLSSRAQTDIFTYEFDIEENIGPTFAHMRIA